jgi:hypothetical protein
VQQVKDNKANAPSAFSILLDDQDMLACFIDFPAIDHEHPFAPDCDRTLNAQNEDATSMQSLASKPNQHGRCQMSPTANLICHIPGPNQPFKTCMPDAMLNDIMQVCHLALNHVRTTRLRNSTALHFYHP